MRQGTHRARIYNVHGAEDRANALGVERVLKDNGKYAFLMESAMARYFANRDCRLVQVGGLLDQVGYGIGTQPGDTTGLAEWLAG